LGQPGVLDRQATRQHDQFLARQLIQAGHPVITPRPPSMINMTDGHIRSASITAREWPECLPPFFLTFDEGLLDDLPATLGAHRWILGNSHRNMRALIRRGMPARLPFDLHGRTIWPFALPPPGLDLSQVVKVTTGGFHGYFK
ncbi:hypothetical protein, partial [Spirillospora sp. NPDC048823]|uniref:hypothetical protein n=1 Tax=unclassified Spirillospora TaxID=2642701 RepID=UPI0037217544